MSYRKVFVKATVPVAPVYSLEETAAKLGAALGVSFVKDLAGECKEFPSFRANALGFTVVLLGVPEPEEQVSDKPIVRYSVHVAPDFWNGDANDYDEVDASSYIADLIRGRSGLKVEVEEHDLAGE